jgi:hypothetical protein
MKRGVSNIAFTVIALVLLSAMTGCSQISGLTQTSSSKSPDIVRGAELAGEWRMDQMIVNVEADKESLILLRLDYGDKADGYFYVEKGNSVSFQITGNSLMYEATAKDEEDSSEVDSDRFSFRASQEQGNTYTLTFRNPSESGQTKATIFLEVIYPVGGSLFMPIERK